MEAIIYDGVVNKHKGKFGFIQLEDGSEMFVMPAACSNFQGQIPPIGTAVKFEIVTDAKTGMPRADNLQTADGNSYDGGGGFDNASFQAMGFDQTPDGMTLHSGSIARIQGNFGFITQDSGEEMFVMPAACVGFGKQIPPIGTRVSFSIVTDTKTGRPRADAVNAEDGFGGGATGAWEMPSGNQPLNLAGFAGGGGGGADGRSEGKMIKHQPNFGFILQDVGDEMFVMPAACGAFGGGLPPIGTRVSYTVVTDAKTGRPRADDVHPAGGGGGGGSISLTPGQFGKGGANPQAQPWGAGQRIDLTWMAAGNAGAGAAHTAVSDGQQHSGSFARGGGSFGFIAADAGGEMFVLPGCCKAFGGVFPPIGTRVLYEVVTDPKTGRPRAENVTPEDGSGLAVGDFGAVQGNGMGAAATPYGGNVTTPTDEYVSGTVERISDKYGFIEQDSGEAKMFFMPFSCGAFNNSMPPVGARVQYRVVIDSKSGRPRADDLQPSAF